MSGIRGEAVNYVGYYSEHEENMKTVIQAQVCMALSFLAVSLLDDRLFFHFIYIILNKFEAFQTLISLTVLIYFTVFLSFYFH